MKIDEQYIKSLPLTTNKIEVLVNWELFFSKFSIVSYYGTDKDSRNLAYEQLSEVPTLSVTGIRARWKGLRFPSVHFFIKIEKGKENDILNNENHNFNNTQNYQKIDHLRGLVNIANTCYMNATLQCFAHIKELFAYFQKDHIKQLMKGSRSDEKLFPVFVDLINLMWYKYDSSPLPRVIWRKIYNLI